MSCGLELIPIAILALPLLPVVAPIVVADEVYKSVKKHNSTKNKSSVSNKNVTINKSSNVKKEISTENKDLTNIFTVQTRMTNKELLNAAINEYAKTLSAEEQKIFSNSGDKKMQFHLNNEIGSFEVIAQNLTEDEILKHTNNLYDTYTSLVQQKVYERVVSKLKESNEMTLDNEEVLEDDSIVLTVGVR